MVYHGYLKKQYETNFYLYKLYFYFKLYTCIKTALYQVKIFTANVREETAKKFESNWRFTEPHSKLIP